MLGKVVLYGSGNFNFLLTQKFMVVENVQEVHNAMCVKKTSGCHRLTVNLQTSSLWNIGCLYFINL